MRNNTIIALVAVFLCLFASCGEKATFCNCTDKYSHSLMYFPYVTPDRTISWSDFNPLIKVDEYFLFHDSTLLKHEGDTIMLYGYIERVMTGHVGDFFIYLMPSPGYVVSCGYCFGYTIVDCTAHPVEKWMTEPDRMVFVKGTISCFRGSDGHNNPEPFHHFKIIASQLDSIRF